MITFPTPLDITLPLGPDALLYPGDSPLAVRRRSSLSLGDAVTASEVAMGCHLGTHVDAPSHFIESGESVAELDLSHFYGIAQVVEFPGLDRITVDDVAAAKIDHERHVLIKTRNSRLLHRKQFDPNHCFLAPEAASRLLEFGPLSIGFDYYSLDPPAAHGFPAHSLIARYGIPAFVCLDLNGVVPGEYFFIALPLKMPGVEGLPVRAVLFPSA